MLEILISMCIITFVFLSLLSYQIAVASHLNKMRLKTIAQVQIMNYSDLIRINANALYRKRLLKIWNKDNARLLPNSHGKLTARVSHVCRITLRWFVYKEQKEQLNVFC